MFTVEGRLGVHDVTLHWREGQLSGSPSAVMAALELACDRRWLMSNALGWRQAGLATPDLALWTCMAALDEVTAVRGEVPSVRPEPAVA